MPTLFRVRLLQGDTRDGSTGLLCRLASSGESDDKRVPCHRDEDGFDDERAAAAACGGSDEGDDVDGCIGAPRLACCCCWGLARHAAGRAEPPVASLIIDAISDNDKKEKRMEMLIFRRWRRWRRKESETRTACSPLSLLFKKIQPQNLDRPRRRRTRLTG